MRRFWSAPSWPPSRRLRIFAAVMGLLFVVVLIGDHDEVSDFVIAGTLCALMSLTVFAPSRDNEARLTAWSRRHPHLNAAVGALLLIGCWFSLLTMIFGDRIGLLVGVPVGLVLAAYVVPVGLRRPS